MYHRQPQQILSIEEAYFANMIAMFWLFSQDKITSVCLKIADVFFLEKVRFDHKNIRQITLVGTKLQTRASIYESAACIAISSGVI